MPASRAKMAATAARRTKAIQMRLTGADYQAIADTLGYNSRGAACQDISRALEQHIAEQTASVEVLRQEELHRLDALLVEAWTVLKRHHVTVSQGRIIYDETTGEALLDDSPVLAAIDRILRIQERRAKYLGLDAPLKVEAITIDAIDAEIRRLSAELGGIEAGEAAPVASASD